MKISKTKKIENAKSNHKLLVLISFVLITLPAHSFVEPTSIDLNDYTEKSSTECNYFLQDNPYDVVSDLMTTFDLPAEKEGIYLQAIEKTIYPRYTTGICNVHLFFADLNKTLDLNLSQSQIDSAINQIDIKIKEMQQERGYVLSNAANDMNNRLLSTGTPAETSLYLIGSTQILIVYVDTPNHLWSLKYINDSMNELHKMVDLIKSVAPSRANLSFQIGYYQTSLDTSSTDVDTWMDNASKKMGFSDTNDMANYAQNRGNTNNVVLIFSPYKSGRSYANAAKGAATIYYYEAGCDVYCTKESYPTYAHELFHLFGAEDEYYLSSDNSGCGQTGNNCSSLCRWGYYNGNCEKCNSASVDCIMKNSHITPVTVCPYTRGQIGWGDHDNDGILDPLDDDMTTVNISSCGLLNVERNVYKLTSDILDRGDINERDSCMFIGAKNVVLDCQGHIIDGIDSYDTRGITSTYNNVTIKNCSITDWYIGVQFWGVDEGVISDNVIESNYRGIEITNGSGNYIFDNKIFNYSQLGVAMWTSTYNQILNNSIIPRGDGDGMAISLLSNSLNNYVAGNKVYYNPWGLIIDQGSKWNLITSNFFCNNPLPLSRDIYNQDNNSGYNNMCDTVYNWNDGGYTGCTYKCIPTTTTTIPPTTTSTTTSSTSTSTSTSTTNPAIVAVSRILPDSVVAGKSYTVNLMVDISDVNRPNALNLTEIYPTGWNISNITFNGTARTDSHHIEWVFSAISNPVQDCVVNYTLLVPQNASGTYNFSGHADIGTSNNILIQGSNTLTIGVNCAMRGDQPPCGEVSLIEVINGISNWSSGSATLSEVISLITAWASSG